MDQNQDRQEAMHNPILRFRCVSFELLLIGWYMIICYMTLWLAVTYCFVLVISNEKESSASPNKQGSIDFLCGLDYTTDDYRELQCNYQYYTVQFRWSTQLMQKHKFIFYKLTCINDKIWIDRLVLLTINNILHCICRNRLIIICGSGLWDILPFQIMASPVCSRSG